MTQDELTELRRLLRVAEYEARVLVSHAAADRFKAADDLLAGGWPPARTAQPYIEVP